MYELIIVSENNVVDAYLNSGENSHMSRTNFEHINKDVFGTFGEDFHATIVNAMRRGWEPFQVISYASPKIISLRRKIC